MKVDSPVGRFPYVPERFRVRGARLVMDGHMGAWPARVEVEASDLLIVARLIARPLAVTAGAAAVCIAVRKVRRAKRV